MNQSKVKPITINLNSAKSQAEYYFNREFNALSHFETLGNYPEDWDIIQPSNSELVREFDRMDFETLLQDYEEEMDEDFDAVNIDAAIEDEDFVEWVSEKSEFEEWRDEREWYPMWNTIWRCSDLWTDSEYCDTDDLYRMGIGVIEHHESGENYLFIAGAGYNFYNQHWIPLFKHIGWIKEDAEAFKKA